MIELKLSEKLSESPSSSRIAWLLPTQERGSYWQPVFCEFTKLFPKTVIFTGHWPGYTSGYENTFEVRLISSREIHLKNQNSSANYGSTINIVSPKIILDLFLYKPAVIFSNGFSLLTLWALLFKFLGKWKVIVALEGSSPSVDYLNSPWRLMLRRLMVKVADSFITNNQAGKIYLHEVLGAPRSKIFNQPYEVPCPKAMSSGENSFTIERSHPNEIIFIYVGQLIPRKGINYLLESCKLVKSRGHEKFKVLIVGDGPQREDLEALSQSNGISNHIIWAGWVDYGTLNAYWEQSDVFILPTLEDTWGMVILEAMTFGKPVLCSRQAGASELIIDGENGYTFDFSDVEKMANKMSLFIENKDLSVSMGQRSKELVSSFNPKTASSFFKEVIELL